MINFANDHLESMKCRLEIAMPWPEWLTDLFSNGCLDLPGFD
jgi:hypothetical protein